MKASEFPEVGRTYQLGEGDYRYGRGPLVVRITSIHGEAVFDREIWWSVDAVAKHPQAVGPRRERHLYVRLRTR